MVSRWKDRLERHPVELPGLALLLLVGAALISGVSGGAGRAEARIDLQEPLLGPWVRSDGQVRLEFRVDWVCETAHHVAMGTDGGPTSCLPVDLSGVKLLDQRPAGLWSPFDDAAHGVSHYRLEPGGRLVLERRAGNCEQPLRLRVAGKDVLVVVPYYQTEYWEPATYEVSEVTETRLVLTDVETGTKTVFGRSVEALAID